MRAERGEPKGARYATLAARSLKEAHKRVNLMVGVHGCSSFCRNIQALKHGFSLIVPCLTLAMRRSHFSMCNALESGILGLSDNLTAFRVSP